MNEWLCKKFILYPLFKQEVSLSSVIRETYIQKKMYTEVCQDNTPVKHAVYTKLHTTTLFLQEVSLELINPVFLGQNYCFYLII